MQRRLVISSFLVRYLSQLPHAHNNSPRLIHELLIIILHAPQNFKTIYDRVDISLAIMSGGRGIELLQLFHNCSLIGVRSTLMYLCMVLFNCLFCVCFLVVGSYVLKLNTLFGKLVTRE